MYDITDLLNNLKVRISKPVDLSQTHIVYSLSMLKSQDSPRMSLTQTFRIADKIPVTVLQSQFQAQPGQKEELIIKVAEIAAWYLKGSGTENLRLSASSTEFP